VALSGIIVTLLTVDFSSSSGCQKSKQLDNNVASMTDSKMIVTNLLFIKILLYGVRHTAAERLVPDTLNF
jgi:hypothetical protein